MAEMKMEQTLTPQGKVWLLSDMVRQTAHESAKSLWSDVLDTVDMDTARCFEQAVTALMGRGSYDKAMGMVTGLYTLCGTEITMDIVACQRHPALIRMFLTEFLAETGEYLTNRDIAELMYNPNERD